MTVTTAPTCVSIGYTYTYCASCNHLSNFEELPALGHNYTETRYEATLEHDAYTVYTCGACGHTYTVTDEGTQINVGAMIGNVKYATLAEALAAANSGDVITLCGNASGNVTVTKNLTIDGAGYTYTGTMTVNTSLTVTVTNVNFVNGVITEAKGTRGTLTVSNYNFVKCG